jgi:hypothetical protein
MAEMCTESTRGLTVEWKEHGIYCQSAWWAASGEIGCDIRVFDSCNANRDSETYIGTHWGGRASANDTAFDDFLTGAGEFTVKGIEDFEIAD